MKRFRRVALIVLVVLPVLAQETDANAEAAETAWEKMIEAKGGRERLLKVQNILITTRYPWPGTSKPPEIHINELFVLPDKIWSWEDYRPTLFGLSISTLDLANDVSYYIKDNKKPANRAVPSPSVRSNIEWMEAIYLWETRWFRPKPLWVSESLDGKSLEIGCQVREGSRPLKAIYRVSSATSLPTRVVMALTFRGETLARSFELSEYRSVDGLQMPGRVQESVTRQGREGIPAGDKSVTYQLNVEYDPAIFRCPPEIEDGPDGWKQAPAGCKEPE